jgi:hypothetical protein
MAAPMESLNQARFSSSDNHNGCARSYSCYSRSQFYLKPTLIFGFHGILFFKENSDFISNLKFNPSGLPSHPYISSGAPPPRIPMPIFPQN